MKIYRLLSFIFLAVFCCLTAVILASPLLSQANPLIFFFTAFQSVLFFSLALLGMGWTTFLLFTKKKQRLHAKKDYFVLFAAIALVLFSGAAGFLTVASRDLVSLEDIPASQPDQLRVLSFNTDRRVSEDDLIALSTSTQPDIIVFPEEWQTFTSSFDPYFIPKSQTEHVAHLAEIGKRLDMNVYFWADAAAQTLFVSKRLGDYIPINDKTPAFAGFYAEHQDQNSRSPKIAVIHLQRPEFSIGTSWWSNHFAWAESMCQDPLSIAVGDFNATAKNIGSEKIGECSNVSALLGREESGTWPSALPAWLGVPIDHVYVGSAYSPVWYGALSDSYGSGHRPVFAILEANLEK